MIELDPTIRAVAEHYGFSIVFDQWDEDDKGAWTIESAPSRRRYNFWFSTRDNGLSDFLNDLRQFFLDCGGENNW